MMGKLKKKTKKVGKQLVFGGKLSLSVKFVVVVFSWRGITNNLIASEQGVALFLSERPRYDQDTTGRRAIAETVVNLREMTTYDSN